MSGDLWLLAGGVFNGQTIEMNVQDRPGFRVNIPIMNTDISALLTDKLPRSLVLDRAEYEVGGRGALRYFSGWRDVRGRPLRGVLLGPKVQRMGMQVSVMSGPEPECPYPADVAEAYLRLESGRRREGDAAAAMLVDAEVWTRWRAEWDRWADMRERQEESALRGVRDSHLVNRQVSPVLREEQPEDRWPGAKITYEWLAEVEAATRGVSAQPVAALHETNSLLERVERMARAEFGVTLPRELQDILDRANARIAPGKETDRG